MGSGSSMGWLGWVAAAACLVVAVLGWQKAGDAAPAVPEVASALDLREKLTREAIDVDRWDWTTTEDEAALFASGYVVWSDDANEGYMTFSGLQPNDEDTFQYQLWIFDSTRPDAYPVDGGIFNVPAGEDEFVVPIDPKIPVRDAALFAVTVEKPGGVVVSDRSRIVVLAQPPAA